MGRHEYYEAMKSLARSIRQQHRIVTARVLRSDLRRVYKAYSLKIDLWPHRLKQLRGAYFADEHGTHVMLAKGLPQDPMVFTMAHELKHHLVDREAGLTYCSTQNERAPIEIGAEVFAAEFIYPEPDFIRDLSGMGISAGGCSAETLVPVEATDSDDVELRGPPQASRPARLCTRWCPGQRSLARDRGTTLRNPLLPPSGAVRILEASGIDRHSDSGLSAAHCGTLPP
jgi:hypothetical protein